MYHCDYLLWSFQHSSVSLLEMIKYPPLRKAKWMLSFLWGRKLHFNLGWSFQWLLHLHQENTSYFCLSLLTFSIHPLFFFCSSTRMKSILPSNISPQPDNGKQWPTHFSTFFPISQIEGGSWSLPNVLQPLFPDLWLHVRHMLGRSCCMFAPRGTTDPPVTWPLFYPLLSHSLMLVLFHNINNVK